MIIAIDLGTTNSLVALFDEESHRLIPNALDEVLTPSCVSIDEDGSILVGAAARERLLTHPARTAAAFKRYMGSDKQIRLGDRLFRPEELSSLVLKSLKADAEAFLGKPVTDAVITVPAYFSDGQRKATRAAAQLAGLNALRLLSEPTAAALAYDLHSAEKEQNFVVVDLGGGTFDVSVLEVFEGVVEVRASAGDNFLGGEDFVNLLTDHVKQKLSLNVGNNPARDAIIKEACQKGIHALRVKGNVAVNFSHVNQPYELTLTELEFDQLCAPLLARLKAPIESAIRDSRIKVANIHNIIFAGGATRLPAVRRVISKLFGRIPISTLNPDEVVARGAAVQAGLLEKKSALSEKFLTDVCPYTLGINVSREIGNGQYESGHFLPIINRNTPIPTSQVKNITTIRDGQAILEASVFQGESRLVKDNIYLGKLELNIEAKKAGEVAVDIRFTYDVDGLLEVEATDLNSGKSKSIVLAGNQNHLSEADIAERVKALSTLKMHPRDRSEARALTAKGDRMYEQTLGHDREIIAQALTHYQIALNSQEDKKIADAQKSLSLTLSEVEDRNKIF